MNSAEVFEDTSSGGEFEKSPANKCINVAQYLNMTSKEATSIPFGRKIIGESLDSDYNETQLTNKFKHKDFRDYPTANSQMSRVAKK